ncbi:TetR/AcrR family transcriptional regulator C-terminal domain-containing protein [Umezawaea beigongshangensis]|uniref:TetR/AcrR family transcriptional regulator C-terminal domain-containing protein n=1 Tax=Umezawaea beigongshangensis TaxID=2780383 RepID=UPI0027DBD8F7|nr:TetR/AcrR family transcriptional regulator C-terminal domain-containing protein [Umezawaea beigongshangensis]
MTKKLTPEAVVRAALELLDERGADAVSLRAVAERLDVRMNTVLWHAKSKTRLLELMADAIVAGASLDGLPEPWDERVRALARRHRGALLAHRDGAAVVTGTFVTEPATLAHAEALVAALLDGGLPEREAAWTAWSITYFVLGLTQEEQAGEHVTPTALAAAVTPHGHPALTRTLSHLGARDFEARFEFGLGQLLRRP